jgi:hypothetical protein
VIWHFSVIVDLLFGYRSDFLSWLESQSHEQLMLDSYKKYFAQKAQKS